ncbi:hypothetical protein PVL29_002934 [Vitis rotundifolia]|uniref:F-box domain-containing protein n=1 Tax=Vitis rotundifolia TaxID=103349 RepID=A0AA39ABK5_VITRO|nr:hypothetical protein PVL29_002934 [Vitis rotundifolia]
MAEWANLPRDLLHLIAKRLDSHFDLLRFRSVCSSWRSSSPSKPLSIFSHLLISPMTGFSEITCAFSLSKRLILQVGLPDSRAQTTSDSWLIKIEKDGSDGIRLINPLTTVKFRHLPPDFPKTIDFSGLRVFELGQEYVLDHHSLGNADPVNTEKAAFCSGKGDDFWLLTKNFAGKLAVYRSQDKKWMIIDDTQSPYHDVTFFDGKFYAVNNTGQTVVVDVANGSLRAMNLAASSEVGGGKKCLVESKGELLLVNTYFSEEYDGRTIRFKVFRLDQREQTWVEIESLDDRLLFLGDYASFSARASDFYGCKENSICFTEISFFSDEMVDDAFWSGTIGVFDLDSGSIGPLSSYSKTIWPPPAWVSSTSDVSNVFVCVVSISSFYMDLACSVFDISFVMHCYIYSSYQTIRACLIVPWKPNCPIRCYINFYVQAYPQNETVQDLKSFNTANGK